MSRKHRENVIEFAEAEGRLSTREHRVIHPQTESQRRYFQSMQNNILTIGAGEAGCGKTLLALYTAMKMLAQGKVERIVYIRPDVGTWGQRGRGFLPGDAFAKSAPLMGPLLDNLAVFMPIGQARYHLEKATIEVLLVEDIRGLSFNHTFAIADEAQNLLPGNVKTFLTRVGEDSRLVLIGDTKQCDRGPEFGYEDGLSDAVRRLRNLKNVGVINFGREDIMRHPIIPEILGRYDTV